MMHAALQHRCKAALVGSALTALATPIALGLGACPSEQEQNPRQRGPSGPKAVEVVAVKLGSVGGSGRFVGELRAPEQVELASKLAGRLAAVTAQLGERVKAGQLLARLDDADLRAQLVEASSGLAVARASVQRAEVEDKNASQELQRKEPLAKQDLITRQELDNVRTRRDAAAAQLAVAGAQVQEVEARVKVLEQQLTDTRIKAPFAGWVDKRFLDPGAVVNPGAPVLRLVKTDPILVRFMVPEREVGALRRRLAEGDLQVDVELDAYPGEALLAQVARVAPSIEATSRSAAVEAEVANADGRLMPGMYGRVALSLEADQQRPLLPLRALIDRRQQGAAVEPAPAVKVFVVLDGVAKTRSVRLGREDSEWGEVVDGLTAGEQVVTAGQSALKDGDPVEVVGAP